MDRVERPYERSKLFEWLLTHHDEFIGASGGRRKEWRRLCGQFESEGLVSRDGKAVTATTARKTWQRVRKEKARIDALRAAERAERERRAATNPRRNMPSQFRKGEYGPPLASTDQGAGKAKLPATTERQAELGLQLSTAEGVVITKVDAGLQAAGGRPGLRLQRRRVDSSIHEFGVRADGSTADEHFQRAAGE